MNKYIIIDFDSTFTQVEGLDELARIALEGKPNQQEIVSKIEEITKLGMEGKLSFEQALEQRIKLLSANKNDILKLVEFLENKVSISFSRNKKFLETYSENILIISSGFREFIEPIVTKYGINPENIYANEFTFDEKQNIIGYDKQILLSKNKGKVLLLRELNLEGEVYVIGDGYTDYEMREAGLANHFYAFTENVERPQVAEKADYILPNLDEFLFIHKLPMQVSYPKHRIKVLLLENVHPKAQEIFRNEGYQVEALKGALNEDELIEKIKDVSILGIRSKTNVTAKVLDHAERLIAIGAYCIGTNQIDLNTCMQKGIAVFNAPYSNTRSVVEMALGEMIILTRQIAEKSQKMHQGVWDKSANNSREIRGKKLGIVGYGNIGSQLSVLAEAMGMQVYFYDVVDKLSLGNAQKCNSLEELLQIADFVTLHVDGRKENENLIGENEFALMKQGVVFLNLARGHIVDIEALVKNIRSGKIAGTAVDVFPYEPKTNDESFENQLRGLSNVILTPHIGGSTEEAQENIGTYVPNKLIEYINTGSTYASVNIPNLQLPAQKNAHRLLHIHKNTAGILAKINLILANHQINILGQYLKTNEEIGYVITDIDKEYSKDVITDLKEIENTIKFRVLY
ncbi:MAG: phosphoglycerate dehydrogenase [Raineya sp.]|jgi:D-3-phosphoglycerate dehydrogenase|nr:phosphoglycerate dehydrogenase [Raineya sp.]